MKEKVICRLFYTSASMLNEYNQFPHKYIILKIPNERITKDKYPGYINSLKAQGMIKGAPDYVITWNKGCAFIEFKKDKKAKQSESQIAFSEMCKELGIPYLLTYDVDEAIDFLKAL